MSLLRIKTVVDITKIGVVKTSTLQDYCNLFLNLLPIGLLWRNLNKVWLDFIKAMAVEPNRTDQRNVDLQNELIPGLSVELLPDWERISLNEDELAFGGTTLESRQSRVNTKIFKTFLPPTKQFFLDFAMERGITINITFSLGTFRVGVNRVGDRLRGEGNVFVWIVDYVSGSKLEYASLEATFRRLKHAHTHLIFNPAPP